MPALFKHLRESIFITFTLQNNTENGTKTGFIVT